MNALSSVATQRLQAAWLLYAADQMGIASLKCRRAEHFLLDAQTVLFF
jgi:hypothetical protein